MRPYRVVVHHPCSDHRSCVIKAEEQRLIQQLIAHLAIEAFDIAILHGLARGDLVPVDLVVFAPGEDGIRREFSSIVTDNHARFSPALDDSCQFACNSLA